jgi:hypothetical protein
LNGKTYVNYAQQEATDRRTVKLIHLAVADCVISMKPRGNFWLT